MSLQLKIDKQAVDPPQLKRLVVDLGSLHALETPFFFFFEQTTLETLSLVLRIN